MELLWYIPNQVTAGHRLDDTVEGHNSLDRLTALARLTEDHGWGGALIGTGWKRPDTFTVATALAARTTTFNPLIAIRPGYWTPAHFASSAATLDQLSGGRVKVNIVSGADHQPQYGDDEGDQASATPVRASSCGWSGATGPRTTSPSTASTTGPRARRSSTGRTPPRAGRTRSSTSGARPRPPSARRPPRPTCSSSGASRSTASPVASTT